MKHGYGKEYNIDQNTLMYEGNFIEDIKNGFGKVYDFNNNLIYEGGICNSKTHGKGKEYNTKGEIIFEGEFFHDKKWTGIWYNNGL